MVQEFAETKKQWNIYKIFNAPNLSFHISLSNGEFQENCFSSLDEAILFWTKLANEEIFSLKNIIKNDELHGILTWLSRLRGAKEFVIQETRIDLSKRIVPILKTLASDKDVREDMIIRMITSIDACNDKPIWALNQMHLIYLISKARGNRGELKKLAKRVMKLNIVHEHCKQKCDSLSFVDDVCVYLRYEIELHDVLDLPVSATKMHFPNYIKIENEDFEKAKEDALSITEKEFEKFLNNWEEWKRQERYETSLILLEKTKRKSWKRLSIINLFGNKKHDKIVIDGNNWSLSDLLKHWIPTGLDLNNVPLTCEKLLLLV